MEKGKTHILQDEAIISFINDIFKNTFYTASISIGIPIGSLKDVLNVMAKNIDLFHESGYFIRLEKGGSDSGYVLYIDRNGENGALSHKLRKQDVTDLRKNQRSDEDE